MAAPSRNLELKALDLDPPRTLEAALARGAEDRGELRQRDTYFHAVQGRLKLREAPPAPAELIAYARADRAAPTVSHYRVVAVADHVALHLDQVAGLGDFVELEAVAASPGGLEAEAAVVEDLRQALGLGDELLVARGYADLLERTGRARRSA